LADGENLLDIRCWTAKLECFWHHSRIFILKGDSYRSKEKHMSTQ